MGFRPGRSLKISTGLVLGLLVLFALQGCGLSAQVGDGASRKLNGAFAGVGSPAPDFVLFDLEWNSITLNQFQGSAVFINFWAT